jgi:hypothetical protein
MYCTAGRDSINFHRLEVAIVEDDAALPGSIAPGKFLAA